MEIMTATQTPLDAYIASQGELVGYTTEWTQEVRDWARETFSDLVTGPLLQNAVKTLYSMAISLPGYDFRMGWLPPLKEILLASYGEDYADQIFSNLANLGGSGSWHYGTGSLYMMAPLSADEVREEATAIKKWLRFTEVHKYRGLLSNPNAPVDWLIEQHAEIKHSLLKEDPTTWNDPENTLAILRNPSMPSDWLAEVLRDLVIKDKRWAQESSDDALTAIAWNPSLTSEAVLAVFPGGITSTTHRSYSESFPFRGILHGEGARGNSAHPAVPLAPHRLDPLMEAYRTRHRAKGWVGGGGGGQDLNVHPTTSGMFSLHKIIGDTVDVLERFHLDTTLIEVRTDVYDAVCEGRLPLTPTAYVANFFANRAKEVAAVRSSFGEDATDIPEPWLHALL